MQDDGPQPATSCGTLLGGRVRYRQPARGFRSGIEPVLLAAAVPAAPGAHVLEGGSGAGAGLLCLAARVPLGAGLGIERDPELASLAARNALINGFGRLAFRAADLLAWRADAPFDHAFANPPYHPASGTAARDAARAAAKQAAPGLIAAWVEALGRALRPGGTLTLILPPAQLDQAFAGCAAARCAPAALLPLWPKEGRDAKLVLLRAVRAGRGRLALRPGLVLHRDDGRFTEAAEAVLRGGGPLAF
ncbi:MAG TPA: SAM-dependent methyltransferase [Acetobacteraceae bacterium]|nr:SAM-dependent methyltransferase [Acetobacteraceae bacterium]